MVSSLRFENLERVKASGLKRRSLHSVFLSVRFSFQVILYFFFFYVFFSKLSRSEEQLTRDWLRFGNDFIFSFFSRIGKKKGSFRILGIFLRLKIKNSGLFSIWNERLPCWIFCTFVQAQHLRFIPKKRDFTVKQSTLHTVLFNIFLN